MKTEQDLLVRAIQERCPIVLILGQGAWIEPDGKDPVLNMALEHIGLEGHSEISWRSLLRTTALNTSFYEWLAERFECRVAPSPLAILREIPWSAVFTSTLDQTLKLMLTGQGREPEVVLSKDQEPRMSRSRARPPIYHLFGHSASLSDPNASPPKDLSELNTRRVGHAVPMLNRVLDTATAFGLIVVDGLIPGKDWLRIDDIIGAIGRAAPEQVLWCGGQPSLGTDDTIDFDTAVQARRILVVPERFGSVLAELRAFGRLPALSSPESEEPGIVSFRDGGRLITKPSERLRIEAVASIVDDAWTAFLAPLMPTSEYIAFRRFHGDLEGPRTLVDGARRGFAIERDFEQVLFQRVNSAIENHASLDGPLILHGQSGTGKSVALARVVAKVREKKAAAVLYAIGRLPQPQDISDFCKGAEEHGAKSTLIVCDANLDVEPYHELLKRLRSIGRRVVVLGSRYRFTDGKNFSLGIEVPATLSENEQIQLASIFRQYLGEEIDQDTVLSSNILAFLYRILPPSRPRIGSGLGAEARATEKTLRLRGSSRIEAIPDTQIAQQMVRAGYSEEYRRLFNEDQNQALDMGDAAGKIIDLVMVPGSLSCFVPVNLLLRTVANTFSGKTEVIYKLFRDLDLFRWKWADSECSELLIAPRLSLEAELICKRRLGGPENESSIIIELIQSVRSTIDKEHELNFLFSLLRNISSDGPRRSRYSEAYVKIAKALTELREQYGVVNASLMLQESAFRRAAIRESATQDDDGSLLEEAREAVQQALDMSASSWSKFMSKRTRQNLQVERASIYGFLAYSSALKAASGNKIWQSYETARIAIRKAVSVTDSYFPLDIGLWVPADILSKSNCLTEMQRSELKADIYDILYQVDPQSFSISQREKFQIRRMKVGKMLQDDTMTEDAFQKLDASDSTAGYYLRAREIAPSLMHNGETFNPEERERAGAAADFLRSNFDRIDNDDRCLSLLLECMWIFEIGRRPFVGNRQPLPHDNSTRHKFLRIVRDLNEASGSAPRNVTRYLEAVLTWITGEIRLAEELFKVLDRDTAYEDHGRVFRRHVLSVNDQKPHRFSGRIEKEISEGHWWIRVEELGQSIKLLSRDFVRQEPGYGREIGDFAIAFNFIGPIADPIK